MNRGVRLGAAVFLATTTACLAGQTAPTGADRTSQAPSDEPASSATRAPLDSPVTCEDAPTSLAELLDGGLAVRGAYVSNLFVAKARDLPEAPTGFDDPWWAVGKINGAGVRPEVGIWLWDRGVNGDAGPVLSGNASASRYFRFDEVEPSLASASQTVGTLVDCVGPIPEP